MNTLYGRKNIYRWTFHSNLGYRRRLDYILCDFFVKKYSTNCRVYRGCSESFESDHMLVVLNCKFPCNTRIKEYFRKHRSKPKIFYNIKSLKNNDIAKQYSDKVEELIDKETSNYSVDDLNKNIIDTILKSTELTIPMKSKHRDNKPWVNDDFLLLINERDKYHHKHTQWKILNKNVKKVRGILKQS